MARRKKITPKEKNLKRGLYWLVTTIATIIFSSAILSIFINQGQVAQWIWWVAGGDAIFLLLLIAYGWFTTNETIAFRR